MLEAARKKILPSEINNNEILSTVLLKLQIIMCCVLSGPPCVVTTDYELAISEFSHLDSVL